MHLRVATRYRRCAEVQYWDSVGSSRACHFVILSLEKVFVPVGLRQVYAAHEDAREDTEGESDRHALRLDVQPGSY